MGTKFLYVFYDYVDLRDNNVIQLWLKDEAKEAMAKFTMRLAHLACTPIGEWNPNYATMLTGQCQGLFEIAVRKQRVRYRILGFHGTERSEVTLLSGFKKKSKEVPVSECEKAFSHKNEVEKNPSERRVEHAFH
ncbi:MAG: type II toxin-antitoxin system RelE/ParE family toxin [Nitrospira sp.]|nr:type II toxin-antitoxin system RelE/ParE family toxin [Nitrospira sp.]